MECSTAKTSLRQEAIDSRDEPQLSRQDTMIIKFAIVSTTMKAKVAVPLLLTRAHQRTHPQRILPLVQHYERRHEARRGETLAASRLGPCDDML